MARPEFDALAEQLISTATEAPRVRQGGKYTRLPELIGRYEGKTTSAKTVEQSKAQLIDFLREIHGNKGHSGGLDGVKSYLRHLAQTYGVEIQGNWDGPSYRLDDLLAEPGVQSIIDHDARKDQLDNQRMLAKDKRSILSQEVTMFGLILHKMGLPSDLMVQSVAISGDRWNDDETSEIGLDLKFDVHPDALRYPILATRHQELTPSSAIGAGFTLIVNIIQTNADVPQIEMKLTDPRIPSMILWHKFTPDELKQLAQEKTKIEQTVQSFNDKVERIATEESVAELLQFTGKVAERIHEAVRE